MTVIIWIVEGTWAACVDATRELAPADAADRAAARHRRRRSSRGPRRLCGLCRAAGGTAIPARG